jgi:zinc protease
MRLEADRMEHMSLTEKQLEAEREVVINERRQRVDNDPGGKLSEVLWDAAFEVHPYGHPTIGWMPDIEGLSLADCLAFYRTYYSPNNAVLVIAGMSTARPVSDSWSDTTGTSSGRRSPPPRTSSSPSSTVFGARRSNSR